MVKLEVTKKFNYNKCEKFNIIKKQDRRDGVFVEGDVIECDNETATYLDGQNPLKESFVKVLEITVPAKEIETEPEIKVVVKKSTKKNKKKLDK